MKFKLLSLFFVITLTSKAQIAKFPASEKELYQTISTLDSSLFSIAYKCKPEQTAMYFTDDLEFYHDKGGITKTLTVFIESLRRNFCDPKREVGLKRMPVPGTMQVFPMGNYGAVQTGEHYFYEVYKGGEEKRVGIARYTHLWLLTDGVWKISRVLSYDHRPAQ
ncbi:nuclear transport factor 2 family protein [Solitalea lacus]|uniref:nuclear transport factor 2 family protein n=1 Tax=Solitalea lacus TaxID=2911172 RepID=UPI001EDA4422|nr:nuclear transport factor 2 family protein [Solitalea lacus]UKJ08761.1 nuclear transport factor 2 family protein [Solitalea lacus]